MYSNTCFPSNNDILRHLYYLPPLFLLFSEVEKKWQGSRDRSHNICIWHLMYLITHLLITVRIWFGKIIFYFYYQTIFTHIIPFGPLKTTTRNATLARCQPLLLRVWRLRGCSNMISRLVGGGWKFLKKREDSYIKTW